MGKKRILVSLEEEIIKKLDEEAEKQKRSRNNMIDIILHDRYSIDKK